MIQIEEIHKGGRCFAFDSNFLADFAAWDRELALLLAVEEGVTMQEDSWKACHILREVFALEQAPPVQRVLMKRFAAAVGREVKEATLHFYQLFPQGPVQAQRIAGLPKPARCCI